VIGLVDGEPSWKVMICSRSTLAGPRRTPSSLVEDNLTWRDRATGAAASTSLAATRAAALAGECCGDQRQCEDEQGANEGDASCGRVLATIKNLLCRSGIPHEGDPPPDGLTKALSLASASATTQERVKSRERTSGRRARARTLRRPQSISAAAYAPLVVSAADTRRGRGVGRGVGQHRVDVVERPPLPFPDVVHDGVGDAADQVTADPAPYRSARCASISRVERPRE
jgi:hypothetical protein